MNIKTVEIEDENIILASGHLSDICTIHMKKAPHTSKK